MGGDLTVNSIPTDSHLKMIFSPGAGDLSCNFSMKPRIKKTRSSETIIVYFCIHFCLFWHFGI